MTNQPTSVADDVVLPKALVQAVCNYLGDRPWKEVQHMLPHLLRPRPVPPVEVADEDINEPRAAD